MKVYELAKERGVNAKQLAKQLGLKSHLSIIPDCILKEETISEEDVVPVVEIKSKQEVTEQEMIGSIKGLGVDSLYWDRRKEFKM